VTLILRSPLPKKSPLLLPRKKLLSSKVIPSIWDLLVRGPSGGLLRGPLGGLAKSLACCCDPACCDPADLPASLTFSVISGTGDCADCAPYSFTIDKVADNSYSGTSDPTFCEANLSGSLDCVAGSYVIGASCIAGTVFGSATATLVSCNPFEATATITLAGGCIDTPPCCCGDIVVEVTE
jgi:hypothetical protein